MKLLPAGKNSSQAKIADTKTRGPRQSPQTASALSFFLAASYSTEVSSFFNASAVIATHTGFSDSP